MSPINRRQWLKAMGTFAVGSFLPTHFRQTSTPPNVLLIVADDLNNWCLGYHPDVKTPHIDRLIQRGTLFANAFSPGVKCNPSRTAFLSGLYPSSTGIYENNVDFRLAPRLKNHLMLPEYFAQHGYKTFGSGKFSHWKAEAIWDETFNLHPDGLVTGIDHPTLAKTGNRNGLNSYKPRDIDWGGLNHPDSAWQDWENTQWVTQLMSTPHEQPFFIGLGLLRTHSPFYIPQHYLDTLPHASLPATLKNDLADVPAGAKVAKGKLKEFARIKEKGLWEDLVRHYIACIHYIDARIGEVLDALDASPYADNTIVLLWSDHGKLLGQKDFFGKGVLWDDGLHIPLVIAGAGIPQATRVETPVNLLDMHQTIIKLCGLPLRTDTDSKSLSLLMQNPNMKWDRPVLTVRNPGEYTVRTTDWRFSRYADNSEELYNHNADPREWFNLALEEDYQPIKKSFIKYFPIKPYSSVTTGYDNDD